MAQALEKDGTYDQVAESIAELGYRLLEEDESADVWEVASGILAGAVQFWLYSRQPCKDPLCQACADISSPDKRVALMLQEVRALSEESDYYSTLNDVTYGSA
jgi:hypothetical protein